MMSVPRPKIVCLCGSTRFYEDFMYHNYRLTMEGCIVLSIGFFTHRPTVHRVPTQDQRDNPRFIQPHGSGVGCTDEQKIALDELHKRKIDLADEVFVINVGGYIGESTRSEIEYAVTHCKPVRYFETINGVEACDEAVHP